MRHKRKRSIPRILRISTEFQSNLLLFILTISFLFLLHCKEIELRDWLPGWKFKQCQLYVQNSKSKKFSTEPENKMLPSIYKTLCFVPSVIPLVQFKFSLVEKLFISWKIMPRRKQVNKYNRNQVGN